MLYFNRTEQQRADFSEPSCVSMKSDASIGALIDFKGWDLNSKKVKGTFSKTLINFFNASFSQNRAEQSRTSGTKSHLLEEWQVHGLSCWFPKTKFKFKVS